MGYRPSLSQFMGYSEVSFSRTEVQELGLSHSGIKHAPQAFGMPASAHLHTLRGVSSEEVVSDLFEVSGVDIGDLHCGLGDEPRAVAPQAGTGLVVHVAVLILSASALTVVHVTPPRWGHGKLTPPHPRREAEPADPKTGAPTYSELVGWLIAPVYP